MDLNVVMSTSSFRNPAFQLPTEQSRPEEERWAHNPERQQPPGLQEPTPKTRYPSNDDENGGVVPKLIALATPNTTTLLIGATSNTIPSRSYEQEPHGANNSQSTTPQEHLDRQTNRGDAFGRDLTRTMLATSKEARWDLWCQSRSDGRHPAQALPAYWKRYGGQQLEKYNY
ncbi:hypothetical protein B0O80DRAFT_501153 [Mortierella sp. GBAus27b]|nr:hypothetical protein B0O80DRAFT_501153 [Mortierella sp. GBAus27b]